MFTKIRRQIPKISQICLQKMVLLAGNPENIQENTFNYFNRIVIMAIIVELRRWNNKIGKIRRRKNRKGGESERIRTRKVFFFYFVCFRKTLASHLRSFHGINLNNLFSLVEASEQRKDRKEIIYQMMWQAKQACL